jgi:tRNA modification GTPase
VVNKCDLEVRLDVPDGLLRVSARSGLGLPGLETAITEGILGGSDDAGDRWVAGARQEALLIEAGDALRRAQTLVRTSPEAAELVAEELRSVLESLDALTGERTGDEVLDVIFSTFCIGK